MKAILLSSLLVFSGVAQAKLVEVLDIATTNSKTNSKWGTVLTDIVQHECDSNSYDDLVTLGHETTHGINSYIRNSMNHLGRKANGFYILNGKAVVIAEPTMMKHDVAPFVPHSLQGSRYSMYITGMPDWDDTPLYVWDEWVAYTNGGAAGVDIEKAGLWSYGWRDAVMGPIEFTVYGIALVMAVKEKDPELFADEDFRSVFQQFIQRSMSAFREGQTMIDFKWDQQDAYYESFKTSSDAEPMRTFIRDMFGMEWCYMVLGF